MPANSKQPYLVVDLDDLCHLCYVDDVFESAVVHAEKGLHVYAPVGPHTDDQAVTKFAEAMKSKLAKARDKGRTGWENPALCATEVLCDQFIGHISKGNEGNFEDLANFAMMLHQRGESPYSLVKALMREPAVLQDSDLTEQAHHYTDMADQMGRLQEAYLALQVRYLALKADDDRRYDLFMEAQTDKDHAVHCMYDMQQVIKRLRGFLDPLADKLENWTDNETTAIDERKLIVEVREYLSKVNP